ncbi:MAG: hypothetical protein IMW95_08380 [Moorella humiferrea]|nr:hypothetical protein [Moorella humiferrea]
MRAAWEEQDQALERVIFLIYWQRPGPGTAVPSSSPGDPADVIIVLSGEQGERVATGVKLYHEYLAPRLLMTSGPVKWKRNERPGGEQIRRDLATWQGQLGKIGWVFNITLWLLRSLNGVGTAMVR